LKLNAIRHLDLYKDNMNLKSKKALSVFGDWFIISIVVILVDYIFDRTFARNGGHKRRKIRILSLVIKVLKNVLFKTLAYRYIVSY